MQRNDTSPGDNVSTQNIADSTASSTDLANARADMTTLTNMDISPDRTILSNAADSTSLSQIGDKSERITISNLLFYLCSKYVWRFETKPVFGGEKAGNQGN